MATWNALALGAGGFISGLDVAADGTLVARTDTYGAYKHNGTRWVQMVTALSLPGADWNVDTAQGVYEIKIAVSNTNRFWMMYNGRVYKTDDQGSNWTRATPSTNTGGAPNDNYRGFNAKLAIDTQNSAHVWIVGPTLGVAFTSDDGSNWTTISTSQIAAQVTSGYLVAIDPNSSVSGGRKQGIYVFSAGHGVYHSTNGGTTFTLITSSPTTGVDMKCDAAGNLWFIDGSFSGAGGNLYKYTGSGSWPSATGAGNVCVSVAIDPSTPSHIFVNTIFASATNFSLNTGSTWTSETGHTVTAADIPWIDWYLGNNGDNLSAGSSLVINSITGKMLIGMGLGVMEATPITTATSVTWASKSLGIEQLVVNDLAWAPSGGINVAVWDQGTFYMAPGSLDTFRSTRAIDPVFAAGWSVDYAKAATSTIVTLNTFDSNDNSGKSSDGGATWAAFATAPSTGSAPKRGGSIAASTATNYIAVSSDYSGTNKLVYTTNGGSTWSDAAYSGAHVPSTTGATGWGQNYYSWRKTLAADATSNVFYAYNDGFGDALATGIWKSTNSGANWSLYYANAVTANGSYGNIQMKPIPGRAGELLFTAGKWASPHPGPEPLRRLVDNGSAITNTASSRVFEVHSLGFGATKPSVGVQPAVYIAGYVSGVYGIWRCDDFENFPSSETWINIGTYPLDSTDLIKTISGDSTTYGTCYVGFLGSGAAYTTLSSNLARGLNLWKNL